ncbi:RNA-binding protein [Candidatus Micrarchaeota archaeon]|nr:RNA-binding protein [Candidatus Micrarchaeota archaeon]MBI5177489.1 RNA-binding protein [Candidatus Micrarchaeota archaeon]
MDRNSICGSCGRSGGVTTFPCPNSACGGKARRCKRCRENEVASTCKSCGFALP